MARASLPEEESLASDTLSTLTFSLVSLAADSHKPQVRLPGQGSTLPPTGSTQPPVSRKAEGTWPVTLATSALPQVEPGHLGANPSPLLKICVTWGKLPKQDQPHRVLLRIKGDTVCKGLSTAPGTS